MSKAYKRLAIAAVAAGVGYAVWRLVIIACIKTILDMVKAVSR